MTRLMRHFSAFANAAVPAADRWTEMGWPNPYADLDRGAPAPDYPGNRRGGANLDAKRAEPG